MRETILLDWEYLEQEKQRRINQRAIQKKRLKLVWVNPNSTKVGKNEQK